MLPGERQRWVPGDDPCPVGVQMVAGEIRQAQRDRGLSLGFGVLLNELGGK